MTKFFTIVKREFSKSIKKPSFWLLTFWIPVIYAIVFWIFLFSNLETEKNLKEKNESIKNIFIFDESSIISEKLDDERIKFVSDFETWHKNFLWKEENIFLHYEKNFLEEKKINLFVNSKDFLDSYSQIAEEIARKSILDKISQKDLTIAYAWQFNTNIKKFQNWEEIKDLTNKNIIAIFWAFIFFFMMVFWSSSMLTSTTQEKENRIVEIILSSVSVTTFVSWKIFWWLLVLLFQFFVFLFLPVLSLIIFREKIPLDILQIFSQITFFDIFIMFFYIISGFLIFAWIMVSVWSLATNSKQAANLASPFTLMSILPLYLSGALMSNPTWILAIIFSYFPITSSMVLLYRSSIWEFLPYENIYSIIITIIFVIFSLFLAKKSFEKWVLEYNNFSVKNIFSLKK